MRLRNVQGSTEEIEKSHFVILEPEKHKGNWDSYFQDNHPLQIEIGMGKGKFLIKQACLHPDINYIGIEKYSSVLVRAVQKCEQMEDIPNLRFIRLDAEQLPDIFGENEVSQIFLNFSDPWPKDRHAKRRLTSNTFLSRYELFLKKDGFLIFKTDNRPLFEFSVEELKANDRWVLVCMTYDLHNSEYAAGNVKTEYEEKFSAKGNPIHMMTARLR